MHLRLGDRDSEVNDANTVTYTWLGFFGFADDGMQTALSNLRIIIL